MITIDGRSYDIIEDMMSKMSVKDKNAAIAYVNKNSNGEEDAEFLMSVLGLSNDAA